MGIALLQTDLTEAVRDLNPDRVLELVSSCSQHSQEPPLSPEQVSVCVCVCVYYRCCCDLLYRLSVVCIVLSVLLQFAL